MKNKEFFDIFKDFSNLSQGALSGTVNNSREELRGSIKSICNFLQNNALDEASKPNISDQDKQFLSTCGNIAKMISDSISSSTVSKHEILLFNAIKNNEPDVVQTIIAADPKLIYEKIRKSDGIDDCYVGKTYLEYANMINQTDDLSILMLTIGTSQSNNIPNLKDEKTVEINKKDLDKNQASINPSKTNSFAFNKDQNYFNKKSTAETIESKEIQELKSELENFNSIYNKIDILINKVKYIQSEIQNTNQKSDKIFHQKEITESLNKYNDLYTKLYIINNKCQVLFSDIFDSDNISNDEKTKLQNNKNEITVKFEKINLNHVEILDTLNKMNFELEQLNENLKTPFDSDDENFILDSNKIKLNQQSQKQKDQKKDFNQSFDYNKTEDIKLSPDFKGQLNHGENSTKEQQFQGDSSIISNAGESLVDHSSKFSNAGELLGDHSSKFSNAGESLEDQSDLTNNAGESFLSENNESNFALDQSQESEFDNLGQSQDGL